MKTSHIALAALILIFLASTGFAEEKEYLVQIREHHFYPDIIQVPANQKFKLLIENLDKTLEEFESHDLKKEKLVGGSGKKITIVIDALKPGEYRFFGDFHQKTAQGRIIAK
jgi:sulfur transfer protein SufE